MTYRFKTYVWSRRAALAASALMGLVVAIPLYSVAHSIVSSSRRHHLTGIVRSGGRPVPDFWLQFRVDQRDEHKHLVSKVAQTDQDGKYHVILDHVGTYEVRLQPLRYMPVGFVRLTVTQSDGGIEFEIPDTALWLSAADGTKPSQPWQLQLHDISSGVRAGADLTGFVRAEDLERPVVGLPVAKWRIFVDGLPDLVSNSPNDVDFRAGREAKLAINLERGPSRLTLLDELGNAVRQARVFADARRVSADDNGNALLSRVAPELPLLILADGFVPTCILAPRPGATRSVHLRRPAAAAIELTLGPETQWPFGLWRSRSDECYIAAKAYRSAVTDIKSGLVTVRVQNLADERYEYAPSGITPNWTEVKAGHAHTIEAPMGCTTCSVTYDVLVRHIQ